MRINPVNVYPAKSNVNVSGSIAAFKGLYGRVSEQDERNRVYQVQIDHYYHNYYPFKNETEEEIKAEKEKLQKQDTYRMPFAERLSDDSFTKENHLVPKETKRLPFTKEEYESYEKNPSELSWGRRLFINGIVQECEREARLPHISLEGIER